MSEGSPASPLAGEMLPALEDDLRATAERVAGAGYGRVREMIGYHLGWTDSGSGRGKRIRPLLTLLACAAAGGRWREALPAASSVELIHNFSLVHDDIQDRSESRRGRPTLWKRWGIAQALNTGDTIFVLARLAAGRLLENGVRVEDALAVQRTLDEACLALTLGQHLDLAFEAEPNVSEEMYLEMIAGKTAALLEAACQVGARLGGASEAERDAYRRFGRHLGLAFQILDDALGVWGEPGVTGKSAGDDLAARKKSFPVVFGLAHSPEFSRRWAAASNDPSDLQAMAQALRAAGADERAHGLAQRHTDEALAALEEAAPAGRAGAELRALSLRLLHRRH